MIDPTDVDIYQIETPADLMRSGAADSPLVMTVTVRATQVNGIMPTVSVFDENRELIPAVVLAHGDGTDTIQIADAQPDSDYFIRVSADPTSGKVVGNYDLDVEYGHVVAAPVTFLDGSLGGPVRTLSYDLVVNEPQFFDFLLAATAGTAASGEAVRMVLTDDHGRIVASRIAQAGATAGGDPVPLAPGVYQAHFVILDPGSGPSSPIGFRLYGASLTDPIGPALDDPTLRPVAVPTNGDPSVASLPILGSASAPFFWLALSLGGQNATGPGAGQAFSTTLTTASLIPAQGTALSPVDPVTPAIMVVGVESLAGVVDSGVCFGSPLVLSRYDPTSASEGATLVLSSTPARENLHALQPVSPGNLAVVADDALSAALDDSRLAARRPLPSITAPAVEEPLLPEADHDHPLTQTEPRTDCDTAGVRSDLANVVVVLGTAAVVYSRLHSARSDNPGDSPPRSVRTSLRFRRS